MPNSETPKIFSYESMGTTWRITIWDQIPEARVREIEERIITLSKNFDELYSRFIKTSLVWQIAENAGAHQVPADLIQMLIAYQRLYIPSEKKLNPLIGFSISDLGYDLEYSLTPHETIRPTPDLFDTLSITPPNTVTLREPSLIDVGALGKGYFVDKIASVLESEKLERFLVDGSGDIFYSGGKRGYEIPIDVGLEDPRDPSRVIGRISLTRGSICASAVNRRAWKEYHHVIDPTTLSSPQEILATWVLAPTATYADGIASCLFFVPPENLTDFTFEYCILNQSFNIKRSAGFRAELF